MFESAPISLEGLVKMEQNYGQNGTTGTQPSRLNRIMRWWPLVAVSAVFVIAGVVLNTDNPVTRAIASGQKNVSDAAEEINSARQKAWTDLYNKHFCQQTVQLGGRTVDATVSEDHRLIRIEKGRESLTYRLLTGGRVERTYAWPTEIFGLNGTAKHRVIVSHMPPVMEDCRR